MAREKPFLTYDMSRFISETVKISSIKSLEDGRERYRQYFAYTTKFLKCKPYTDALLSYDGYSDCIVEI